MDLSPQMAADEQLRRKLLPEDWKWVLVRGKDAFGQGTSSDPLDTEKTLGKVDSRRHRQTGLGVVTGDASNGLVAVDIDGPVAEELFKEVLGEDWPDAKKPGTMSWRGRPGRRQLLYKLPDGVRSLLTKFTKAQFIEELKGTDEEVCIRYNGCYSVIPGSKHPDTKKPYEWIDRNDGVVAQAPGWLVDFMMKSAKPAEVHSFIPKEYLERQDASTDFTYRQMRRHFWMEGGLLEKLLAMEDGFDKVFNSEVWEFQPLTVENQEKGTMVGGCPFHDSNSGKSFTIWPDLNWYCHKEEVGGDALKLLHALRERDINAGDPSPVVLQGYLQEIAEVVGVRYPEDFKEVQKTQEVKKYDPIGGPSLLQVARKIIEDFPNPAEQDLELLQLAGDYGVRKDAEQIRVLLQEDEDYKRSGDTLDYKARQALITGTDWLIPDVLKRPSTVLLHGDGGCGKSLACQVLAKHIGRGIPFKVRGAEMPVKQGPVLWCNADQSLETLEEQLDAQGIANEGWFHVYHDFRLRHTNRLAAKIRQLEPALVIIDSLAASQPTVDGNKQIVSSPLYWLEANNGTAFPKCTFVVIHHNNKQGGFRGHSSIRDAVSETWSISKPTDQEMQENAWGDDTFRRRKITIGKSRSSREGDELITYLHEDFTMDLEDFTPVQRFRPGGSVSVYDRVHSVIRDATDQERPLKRSEIETMVSADGGTKPSASAIRKSLQRLEARELITGFDCTDQKRLQGKKEKSFLANTSIGIELYKKLSTHARGECLDDFCPISEEPSGGQGFQMGQPNGTANGTAPVVPFDSPPDAQERTETDRCTQTKWDSNEVVPFENPVIATDLPNGTNFEGNREKDLSGTPVRQPLSLDELIYPPGHSYGRHQTGRGDAPDQPEAPQ